MTLKILYYQVSVIIEGTFEDGTVSACAGENGPKCVGQYKTAWKAGDLQKKLLEIAAIINDK